MIAFDPLFFVIFFTAVFAIIFIAVLVPAIRANSLKNKIKEFNGQTNSRGEGVLSIDGWQVNIKYVPGSKNRSPEFSLYASGSFGADLTIRKETPLDRFFKNIGLNNEVQIMDPELNEKFYFECDAAEFLKPLLSGSDAKQLILDVFEDFNFIEITKSRCTFRKYPSTQLADISKETITAAGQKLVVFVGLIPSLAADHPELVVFKRWRLLLYFAGGFSLAAGLAFLVWADTSFRVVDAAKAWVLSFEYFLAVFFPVSYLAFLKIRGFSTSARVFIPFVLTFGIGALLLLRFGGAAYNGIYDASEGRTFEQAVINKYTTTHKSSTTHHVVLAPWHEDMNGWHFTVTSSAYARVHPGLTHCRVFTKSGALGLEWVVFERLIDTAAGEDWPSRDYSHWYPLPPNAGMESGEYVYWQQWQDIIQDGITNRMGVQQMLDRHSQSYSKIKDEYLRRQQKVLGRLEGLEAPPRLQPFKEYVVSAGYDQIRFYEDYAQAKVKKSDCKINEFLNNVNLAASDRKLHAAADYFKSLYPSMGKAMNDAVEQRLAWFDII